MANNFLDTNWVSMKMLWFLDNSREIAANFNSDWESELTGKSFPVGSTIQVKLPNSPVVTSGLAYQEQSINRLATTLSLDQIFNIHQGWDSYEKLVKMERSEKELDDAYFKPNGKQLAQELDSRAAQWAYQNASNVFGVLGTDATTISPFTAAQRRLYEKACPEGDTYMCLSPSLMESYVKNNVTQFNPTKEISDMFRTGIIGTAAGAKWVRSNSLYKHTCGTAPTGGVTINGAGQSGSTLVLTGTATQTIKKGDKFAITSVNGVNPRTRRAGSMGLQHITALQDLTLTGGADSLLISPALFGPGSNYQNVDNLPVNGAALTFWPGTTTPAGLSGLVSLCITKYAFLIAGGKFETPDRGVMKSGEATDPDTGLHIAYVQAWDQFNRKTTNRWDCCVGFGNATPDNGCVALAGA